MTTIITIISIFIYLLQCIGLALLFKKANITWWLAFVPFGNYIVIGKIIKDIPTSLTCGITYFLSFLIYIVGIPHLCEVWIPTVLDYCLYASFWVIILLLLFSYCRLMIKLCTVFKTNKKLMCTAIVAPTIAICLFGMNKKYKLTN